MNAQQSAIKLVVLAGGSGTRFWPASRRTRPKQLLPLTGTDPMISLTVDRLLPLLDGHDAVFIASGKRVEQRTRETLPDVPASNHLVEPCARNTAPCIGWATARIAREDPEAIIVVLPSDHHVRNVEEFRRVVGVAIETARSGRITTIGITPTRPDTGFGYIELGASQGEVSCVKRFVEKPSLVRAEEFLAAKTFLWNAGMFIYRAKDMMSAIGEHLPALAEGLAAFDRAAERGEELAEVEKRFSELPSVSIDVGVMEKVAGLAVVSGDFGWSDVGSWQAAYELASHDQHGNAGQADARFLDASGNLVVDVRGPDAPKKTIVLLGVSDLVVVDTPDALLVVPRDRCQDVRQAVESLEKDRPESI